MVFRPGPQLLTADLTLLTTTMLLQALTRLLSASLFHARSPPSPLYLSIIKVGIDPSTILSLSACSHRAKTCLLSLNQWHLPALAPTFPHVGFGFSRLKLNKFSYMFQFGLAEKGKMGGWKTGVVWLHGAAHIHPLLVLQPTRVNIFWFCLVPWRRSPGAKQPACLLPG